MYAPMTGSASYPIRGGAGMSGAFGVPVSQGFGAPAYGAFAMGAGYGSGMFAGGSFRTGGTSAGSGYRGVTGSTSSVSFGGYEPASRGFTSQSAYASQPAFATSATSAPTPAFAGGTVTLGSRRAARGGMSAAAPATKATFGYVGGSAAPDFDYWNATELPSFDEISDAAEPAFDPEPKRSRKSGRGAGESRTTRQKASKGRPAAEGSKAVAAGNAAAMPGQAVRALCFAVLVLCVTLFAFVRIEWSAATTVSMTHAQQLEQSITSAREAGKIFEVGVSKMTVASNVTKEAVRLGLIVPDVRESLYLLEDTVTVDADGVLSLSGSVAVVADNAR